MSLPSVCVLSTVYVSSGGAGAGWGRPFYRHLLPVEHVAPAALWPTWLTSSGMPSALSISSRPSKFRKARYSWSRRAPSSLGDSAAGCGQSRSSGELPNGCLQRDKLHHGSMDRAGPGSLQRTRTPAKHGTKQRLWRMCTCKCALFSADRGQA